MGGEDIMQTQTVQLKSAALNYENMAMAMSILSLRWAWCDIYEL